MSILVSHPNCLLPDSIEKSIWSPWLDEVCKAMKDPGLGTQKLYHFVDHVFRMPKPLLHVRMAEAQVEKARVMISEHLLRGNLKKCPPYVLVRKELVDVANDNIRMLLVVERRGIFVSIPIIGGVGSKRTSKDVLRKIHVPEGYECVVFRNTRMPFICLKQRLKEMNCNKVQLIFTVDDKYVFTENDQPHHFRQLLILTNNVEGIAISRAYNESALQSHEDWVERTKGSNTGYTQSWESNIRMPANNFHQNQERPAPIHPAEIFRRWKSNRTSREQFFQRPNCWKNQILHFYWAIENNLVTSAATGPWAGLTTEEIVKMAEEVEKERTFLYVTCCEVQLQLQEPASKKRRTCEE